jgi:hypothetical protein
LTAPFAYLLFAQWTSKETVQHQDDIKHHRVKNNKNNFSHTIKLRESIGIKDLRRFFSLLLA